MKDKDRERERHNQTRRINKVRAVEYKGGRCCVCGYDRCARALHFHHIRTEEKSFNPSDTLRSWENIRSELDKCILVCANCHAEIEAGIIVL